MLLFISEHAPLILSGQKTQTRRMWKDCRVKVGSIHKCYTGGLPFSKCPECCGAGWEPADVGIAPCRACDGKGRLQPFASVRILRVWQEPLSKISADDCVAEGYANRADYWYAFYGINKIVGALENDTVWAVEFELA
jgi:hypothetical protein